MGQCLGIGEVIDCYKFQVLSVQTCPKDISANSTKPINSNPDRHIAPSFFGMTFIIYLFSIPDVNIFSEIRYGLSKRDETWYIEVKQETKMEKQKRLIRNRNLLEIVRGLLQSQVIFKEIFKKYKEGRLSFQDIQSWVDDKGQSPLYNLKEQSHSLFRNKGKESFKKKEWLLDLVIGSIFHEAMKLRESVYQLEIYRPKYIKYKLHIGKAAYERDYSQQFERIILKAGQSVLLGVAEIRSLFHDAAEQLIDLFKEKSSNPYLVRFLLEHQSLLRKVYGSQKGKELFNLIFEGGLQEAYDRAGRSYLLSGHYDLASSYFSKALKLGPPNDELLFLSNFSLGMNAYYKNHYDQTLSFWRKLISGRLKKYLKKHYIRQIQEVCQVLASEWNEEGKPRMAQKALSLADQAKKMLR